VLCCRIPGSDHLSAEQYDRVEAEEARLSDLITGFVDPNAEEDMAPTATHVGSELSQEEMDDDEDEDEEEDDDSSDDDNSIDPSWRVRSLPSCVPSTK
jgi:RNA polymerase primary sigma factor